MWAIGACEIIVESIAEVEARLIHSVKYHKGELSPMLNTEAEKKKPNTNIERLPRSGKK